MESRIDTSSHDKDRSVEERLEKLANDIKRLPPERIPDLERYLLSLNRKVVSLKEAASILGMSQDTLRRAIKAGSIKAFQLSALGNWKISLEEIDRILQRQ